MSNQYIGILLSVAPSIGCKVFRRHTESRDAFGVSRSNKIAKASSFAPNATGFKTLVESGVLSGQVVPDGFADSVTLGQLNEEELQLIGSRDSVLTNAGPGLSLLEWKHPVICVRVLAR